MDYYIVTNDGTNAHRLLEALGVASEKVKHWRNGVDFNMYNPSEQNRIDVCRMLNIDTRSKIVISTSRIMHHYGSDILVKALSRVCRQRDDVVGVIIGEGPQKQSLQEHVLASHLENKIFFTGLLDREELSKFLNAADIFVLLSRFNNCTNTMWEAMVCGKCIITTENNNIKEVLTSGENAILIAPDGLYRFGEILSSIIADEFLQKRLGECARKRALEILESWPKRIKKEIKLIETLSNNT